MSLGLKSSISAVLQFKNTDFADRQVFNCISYKHQSLLVTAVKLVVRFVSVLRKNKIK